MKTTLTAAFSSMAAMPALALSALAAPAQAGEVSIEVDIPRLDVAEYHRPYMALWIAEPTGTAVAPLTVWYDVEMARGEGETWLKDLRQWWRRIGRSADLPIDGVSGPTRAPGNHTIIFPGTDGAFGALEPGDYVLTVEAVREVGGREMLDIPFTWPVEEEQVLTVTGESELGAVIVTMTP